MQKDYLSADKLEELKNELELLKTDKRQEISQRLEESKKLGDLSENSEYIEAKEAQEQNERRIVELENLVKNAVLIGVNLPKDRIQVGSEIEVKPVNGKAGLLAKAERYIIVGSEEADPVAGKISNSSPLGQAFLGHKVGDTVEANTPSGSVKYTITKIL